ncbi:MAG: VOC family protein [Herminiimonas sp.]|nr:VOC family protein [Herminiimonas sp.]
MAIALNHYSIRTANLDACREFYEKVLGLTVGPRPPFPFPGLWMYAGDHDQYANAVVHIIGIGRDDGQGLSQYLGDRTEAETTGSGVIDHVAFFADGLAVMLGHLRQLGIGFRERAVPGIGLYQLFLDDPNGIVVELNYPAHEKAALDASAAPA